MPFAERIGRTVLVAGTFDTKGRELRFMADRLKALGLPVRTVDLSTSGKPARADVPANQVAIMHPRGCSAVMSPATGAHRSRAMAEAFARVDRRAARDRRRVVGGRIGWHVDRHRGDAGAAGRHAEDHGLDRRLGRCRGAMSAPSDILMLHSVADVQGLELDHRDGAGQCRPRHGRHGRATADGAAEIEAKRKLARPAVGLTMFGVTTPAVQAVVRMLEADYDCLVFHATGTGGRSMEALADSRPAGRLLDLTTTEVADMLVGGVFAATEDRFGAAIRTGLPYVGSVGALDMVNFGPRDTVPARFAARRFVVHNPNVTLMRTTVDENRAMGDWIGGRLNLMQGPVRFLLPTGGVSVLDAPGKPFHDPEADAALFGAIEQTLRQTAAAPADPRAGQHQ